MKTAQAAALVGVLLSARAYALTGNQLFQLMQDTDSGASLTVTAYMRGYLDATLFLEGAYRLKDGKPVPAMPFCPPSGYTVDQVRDIAKLYMANSPADRHFDAGVLVMVALMRAWPCPN